MEILDVIDDVCEKYSYSLELKNALKRCIPAMIEEKSEEEVQLLIDALYKVEIFTFDERPSKQQIESIKEKKVKNRNNHVKYGGVSLGEYCADVAMAAYSYDVIYDRNMNVVDKIEYLYITNLSQNSALAEEYGTRIDLTALVHGLGHAWGAQRESYVQETNGNVILRDGMRTDHFIVDREKCVVQHEKSNGIYIEEAMNSIDEENTIMKIMDVSSLDEIKGYKKSTYQNSPMIIMMKSYLSKCGKSRFERTRFFNDKSELEILQEAFYKTRFQQKIASRDYMNEKKGIFFENTPQVAIDLFKRYNDVFFSNNERGGFLENLNTVLEQIFILYGGNQVIGSIRNHDMESEERIVNNILGEGLDALKETINIVLQERENKRKETIITNEQLINFITNTRTVKGMNQAVDAAQKSLTKREKNIPNHEER